VRHADRRQRRRGLGRLAAAALAAVLATPVVLATSPAQAESRRAGPNAVSIDVVSVSPSIPAPSQQLNTLRIQLSIANNTNARLNNVQITAARGLPLTTQRELNTALTHPIAPASGQTVRPVHPITVDLPPASQSGAVSTTFVTTSAVPVDLKPGLCLCADGQVYPVWLQAWGGMSGSPRLLGQSQTFVPSFYNHVNPVHVNWVWPLIDRPHRIVGSTIFTDDSLATSVSTGRLRRCLQVLENVAGQVPVTVVIDPELLDELEIMATQKYNYRTASGQLARGIGRQAASAWLSRLQSALRNNPQVSVVLTPNADPDVDSLARAGLRWSTSLSSGEQQRVLTALGGVTPSTGFAWPPSGTIGGTTLRELHGTGVRSVLLSSTSVQPNNGSSSAPVTLARLANGGHPVVAALTSPQLSRYVDAALGGGTSGSGMPALMASLALLAGTANPAGQQVFLAPPRYIDPAVSLATDAIEDSSSSALTQPANALDVLAAAAAVPRQQEPSAVPAHLVAPPHPPPGLSRTNLQVARQVTNKIAPLKSMFNGSPAALKLVGDLSGGVQRIESAAWRHGSGLGGRVRGVYFARRLDKKVRHLTHSVHIVHPISRELRFTLASTNSPLPITVENDLPYPVHVQVAIRPVFGIPGLNFGEIGPQVIAPNSKSTVHVPTQVQRSGLFRVYAILQTPKGGQQIGRRVNLLVSSTALGTIGVVITVVAGAILLLALLVRFIRRLRARQRRPKPRPRWSSAPASPEPVEPVEPAEPAEPVAPLTETLASPGAAPPPAAPGH
jgi:hypothetical protein